MKVEVLFLFNMLMAVIEFKKLWLTWRSLSVLKKYAKGGDGGEIMGIVLKMASIMKTRELSLARGWGLEKRLNSEGGGITNLILTEK